jgi:UDP-N-acetylmuramoylalanine-D-glutamate ligase
MMIEDLHDRWFDYSIWTTSQGGLLDGFVTQSHLEQIKLRFMDHTRRMIVSDQEASVQIPSALRTKIKISDPHYDLSKTQLRGSHNACNLSAALLIAHRIIGDMDISVSADMLQHAVSSLKPLKYHLIPLTTLYGATIYDDNIAQEPRDQLTALQSVPKPVVLIAMGSMDESQILMLREVYRDRVAVAILHSSCPTALAEYCDQR